MAVNFEVKIFENKVLCSLVDGYKRCGETMCVYLQEYKIHVQQTAYTLTVCSVRSEERYGGMGLK
jgi:hypothetical protein